MTLNCTVKNGSNDKKETAEGKKKEKKEKLSISSVWEDICIWEPYTYICMYIHTIYSSSPAILTKPFLIWPETFFLFPDLCRVLF